MKLSLKYFGQIAEKTGKSEEVFELNEIVNLNDISQLIHDKYSLNGLPFQIAVNKKLSDSDLKLSENDEVAFLPPFAGG